MKLREAMGVGKALSHTGTTTEMTDDDILDAAESSMSGAWDEDEMNRVARALTWRGLAMSAAVLWTDDWGSISNLAEEDPEQYDEEYHRAMDELASWLEKKATGQ